MNAYIGEVRRHPRFELQVHIEIKSRTSGVLKGRTVDISESGIAAMMRVDIPVGEVVELSFTLPLGQVAIYAIARERNAFRFGFEFVESNSSNEIIRHTCRQFAVEQTLTKTV
jgi:hypothetical protein